MIDICCESSTEIKTPKQLFLASHGNYQLGTADLPISSVKDQTLMWQQVPYLHDSGVISETPSLSGKDEEDLFDLNEGYTPGFSQDQVDGNFLYHLYVDE